MLPSITTGVGTLRIGAPGVVAKRDWRITAGETHTISIDIIGFPWIPLERSETSALGVVQLAEHESEVSFDVSTAVNRY